MACPENVVTENAVTKFSLLDGPVPPTSWASQFPLVVVVTVLRGVDLPQPQTASCNASMATIANFFMGVPAIGIVKIILKDREMQAGSSMDVRGLFGLPASGPHFGRLKPEPEPVFTFSSS